MNTSQTGILYQPGHISGDPLAGALVAATAMGTKQLVGEVVCNSNAEDAEKKRILLEAERRDRRLELFRPYDASVFIEALWWMIHQGMEEDLDAVRQIKDAPPFESEDISQLLRIAEEEIEERVNDPSHVMSQGEAALRLHFPQWEQEYRGEFIAIYRGTVVAHAANKADLTQAIATVQREKGQFRAFIVEMGAPTLVVTVPRRTVGRAKRPRNGSARVPR
jgi:hypothetical protein